MDFSPGPCVPGIRVDRFGTPFQPVAGVFISAMVKPLIRKIFIDNSFWDNVQNNKGPNPIENQDINLISLT